MGAEARLLKLEEKLITLGFEETLKAIDLMKKEMSADKGFKRHDGSDYYYHLFDVTLLLINAGIRDEATLTSSVLHDFAEDVDGITPKTIEFMFGKEVGETVTLLTKESDINYKDLENLKQYYVPIMCRWRSCLVKAGDILHNMSTMADATREKKIRKIKEAKEVYIPFLRDARNKYPRYASFFYLVKFSIEPLVREWEERYIEEEKYINQIEELKGSIVHE